MLQESQLILKIFWNSYTPDMNTLNNQFVKKCCSTVNVALPKPLGKNISSIADKMISFEGKPSSDT